MASVGGGYTIAGSEGQTRSTVGTTTRTVPVNSMVRVYSFTCTTFGSGTSILRITSNGQAIDVHTFSGTGVQNFPGGLDAGPSSTVEIVSSGNNTVAWTGTLFTNN